MKKCILNRFALHSLVFLLFVLLAIYMLVPLSIHPATYLPDKGDSFHNIWILGSNVHTLATHPSQLYEANILYPLHQTGTFAETQLISTMLFIPFMWAGAPVLGYNVLLILSFALTGFLAYLILSQLSGSPFGAFVGAIVVAFFPFRFAHLPHVQLLSFQWPLLALYLLMRFLLTPTFPRLIAFLVAFTLQAISPGYSTVFMVLLIGPYLLVWLCRAPRQLRRTWLPHLAGCLAIAALICLPFYLPYLRQASHGFHRTIEDFDAFSMDLLSYLGTPPQNYAYGRWSVFIHNLKPGADISTAFPGWTAVLLVLVGILLSLRNRAKENSDKRLVIQDQRQNALVFAAVGVLFFLISVGPTVHLAGYAIAANPIRFLFVSTPFLSATRYIAAYAIGAIFCFAVVLSCVLQPYLDRLDRWGPKCLVVVLCVVPILGEYRSEIPHTAVPEGSRIPAVYQWLARQPGDFAIVELPVIREIDSKSPAFQEQFEYMYYSVYHHKRLVNGVTGFFPPYYQKLLEQLNVLSTSDQAKLLACLGVRYIIVHPEAQALYSQAQLSLIEQGGLIRHVEDLDEARVYELTGGVSPRPHVIEVTMPEQGKTALPELRLVFDRSGGCTLPDEQAPEFKTTFRDLSTGASWEEESHATLPTLRLEDRELFFPLSWHIAQRQGPFEIKTKVLLGEQQIESPAARFESIGKLSDSHDSLSLNGELLNVDVPSSVVAGSTFPVRARVRNTGSGLWLCCTGEENPPGKAEVHFALKEWRSLQGNRVVADPGSGVPLNDRAALSFNVAPGQETDVTLLARAPATAGRYTASFDMVSELVAWFGDLPNRQTFISRTIDVQASR